MEDILNLTKPPVTSLPDLLASPTDVQLTPHQQESLNTLLCFLTGKVKAPFAVLRGFAGVGKSTVTNKLVNELKKIDGGRIGVCAPTHKAIKVLRKNAIPGIDYRTVHSMLALKESVDHRTGKKSYVPDPRKLAEEPVSDLSYLFVDETSMLNKALFDYLVPWIKQGLKVVFIGE